MVEWLWNIEREIHRHRKYRQPLPPHLKESLVAIGFSAEAVGIVGAQHDVVGLEVGADDGRVPVELPQLQNYLGFLHGSRDHQLRNGCSGKGGNLGKIGGKTSDPDAGQDAEIQLH